MHLCLYCYWGAQGDGDAYEDDNNQEDELINAELEDLLHEPATFSTEDIAEISALLSAGVKKETARRYRKSYNDLWLVFLTSRCADADPYLSTYSESDRRRLLILFMVFLRKWHNAKGELKPKSAQSISRALCSVAWCWKHDLQSIDIFRDPAVAMARKGCKRLDVLEGLAATMKPKRLPMTYDMILLLKEMLWSPAEATVEQKMVFVAILIAFHFMLRCSEYIFDSKTDAEDISHALMSDNVEFVLNCGTHVKAHDLGRHGVLFGQVVCILLVIQTSKADQEGKGRNLVINVHNTISGPQEHELGEIVFQWCLLAALKNGDPFFSRNGSGNKRNLKLQRKKVVEQLKSVATQCGFDEVFFSSHSLRIGGATTMACAGSLRDRIKRIAGWAASSDCDLLYARLTALDGGSLSAIDEANVAASNKGGDAPILSVQQVRLLVPIGKSLPHISGDVSFFGSSHSEHARDLVIQPTPKKRRLLPPSLSVVAPLGSKRSALVQGSLLGNLGQPK